MVAPNCSLNVIIVASASHDGGFLKEEGSIRIHKK